MTISVGNVKQNCFLHYIWDSTLIASFWEKVVDVLSEWSGSVIPLTCVVTTCTRL